ncbi:MAG: MFS transporter [Candidatus Dormiibacterota bacterium]
MRPASAPAGEHLTRPRSARAAVLTMFFVNGAALATWVPLIPAVQQKLGLSASELGIALLGVAVGAVVSTPSTGWLVGRAGGRRVVTLAAILGCVILPLLPVVPALPLLTLTLVVFGAALATMDVAMNIQGAAVEGLYQRPLMSTFHAFYSIGGFAGALVSGGLAAVGVAPFDRALWPAVLLGAAAIVAHQWLPSAEPHTASRQTRVRVRITRQTWPLAALGLMAFCSLLAEGASGDWSALYLHKSLGADAAFAATAFAAFSVAMAVGRLSGDWLTSRLGAGLLLRVGGALAAAGLTATLLLGRPALAIAGFGLVGLGLANVVPAVFSAAGRSSSLAPRVAIAAVASAGYAGLLAGPPLIGFIAQAFTLTRALTAVVVCCGLIALLAPMVRRST